MDDHLPLGPGLSTAPPLTLESKGMLYGLAGVAIFSLTLPFTRMAVAELDPTLVALGRALAAALLAGLWLWWRRAPLPPRAALGPLLIVAAGCVVGFPWLTSIAMQTLPASHGAVMVGVLPLATAVFAALRGGERPSAGFWLTALTGSALVIAFALRQNGGGFHLADLAMLAAVLLAALGYAEGGKLAKTMGGQEVIAWALLLALPLVLPVVAWLAWSQADQIAAASTRAWVGFGYVSLFSMFLGFFFWYRGLAMGGVARVGQVQLVQPFLTLFGAAILLGERLEAAHLLFALAVIAVVAVGRRMQVKH